MINLGYMAKRIETKPDGFNAPNVQAIYAVSNCIPADFFDEVELGPLGIIAVHCV